MMENDVRILVVDDDSLFRDTVCDILESSHYTVHSADTGKAALARLQEKSYAVVLVDLGLPDMSGLEIIKHVKEGDYHAECILLTGMASQASAIEAVNVGAYCYLLKPYNMEQLLLIVRRASEKSLSEKRLKENQRQLTTLISNLPGMAYRCLNDPDWTMVFLSDGCRSLTGYAAAALIQNRELPYNDLIAKEDQNRVWEAVQDAVGRGEPFTLEYRIIHRDGRERWMWEKGRMIRDSRDGSRYLEGFITDITDRKLAERALNASYQRFMRIMDGIEAIVLVTDIDTDEILFMNQYLVRIRGRDMTSQICWETIGKQKEACTPCSRDNLLDASGRPKGSCTWQERDSLCGKWFNYHARAIEWMDGRIVRLVFAMDITNLKKMEAALHQTHKMEAIGTLAGGIAHDFNNILASIIGFTELAMDEAAPGTSLEDNLREVYIAGQRAKKLVHQILAFARQSDEEKKPIRVDRIIEEVYSLIRSTLPATIEISLELHSRSVIIGNATQIYQILMNLSTNAAHAMEEDGGKLVIELRDMAVLPDSEELEIGLNPGAYIMLSVSDTGCGIPEEIMDFIFQPYFTTQQMGEGTGMGLAMTEGIVESHGGRVVVESTLGKGSVFTVYLPVTDREDLSDHLVESQVIKHGNEHLLLVDDEPAIVKMNSRILERAGYQVTARTSSVEALELFRARPDDFHMLITDMTMPHLTGDNLVREILKIRPNLPAILCTGYSKKISVEKARQAGIRKFVHKPIISNKLLETVRSVLDGTDSGTMVG